MYSKRLIHLFDGTWNDPADHTNVYRLKLLIEPSAGSVIQEPSYHLGVGTSRFDKLRGGFSGYGLNETLLKAYQDLALNYHEGDEIWIFGFSRGAYSARSLGGMLRKCGLIKRPDNEALQQALALYRNRDLGPECEPAKAFRAAHSREVRVRFMGVWDTVGSLGIPGTVWSEKGRYAWHDTELSSIVDYAYHAMALDEHRAAYEVPLWVGDGGLKKPENIDVEQRWFIGAHSNVGGGYGPSDPLAALAFEWILGRACAVGLNCKSFSAPERAWDHQPRDSYSEFLKPVYAAFRALKTFGKGRYYRPLHGSANKPGVNVTVDPSVWQRMKVYADYRPLNLGHVDPQKPTSASLQ